MCCVCMRTSHRLQRAPMYPSAPTARPPHASTRNIMNRATTVWMAAMLATVTVSPTLTTASVTVHDTSSSRQSGTRARTASAEQMTSDRDATAESATDWDVVVYGSTPAGIAAATAAGRLGARVALYEPLPLIGGMGSAGNLALNDGQCTLYHYTLWCDHSGGGVCLCRVITVLLTDVLQVATMLNILDWHGSLFTLTAKYVICPYWNLVGRSKNDYGTSFWKYDVCSFG